MGWLPEWAGGPSAAEETDRERIAADRQAEYAWSGPAHPSSAEVTARTSSVATFASTGRISQAEAAHAAAEDFIAANFVPGEAQAEAVRLLSQALDVLESYGGDVRKATGATTAQATALADADATAMAEAEITQEDIEAEEASAALTELAKTSPWAYEGVSFWTPESMTADVATGAAEIIPDAPTASEAIWMAIPGWAKITGGVILLGAGTYYGARAVGAVGSARKSWRSK